MLLWTVTAWCVQKCCDNRFTSSTVQTSQWRDVNWCSTSISRNRVKLFVTKLFSFIRNGLQSIILRQFYHHTQRTAAQHSIKMQLLSEFHHVVWVDSMSYQGRSFQPNSRLVKKHWIINLIHALRVLGLLVYRPRTWWNTSITDGIKSQHIKHINLTTGRHGASPGSFRYHWRCWTVSDDRRHAACPRWCDCTHTHTHTHTQHSFFTDNTSNSYENKVKSL